MVSDAERVRRAASRANTPDGLPSGPSTADLTKAEYEQLAQFRYALRQLARQTELAGREVSLTPQQYQIMLAVRGMPGRDWASITELAERLQIRHNAVIGLVNRAEARGLLERRQDSELADRRVVRVYLTAEGERLLQALAKALHEERRRVRTAMQDMIGL